MKNKMLLLLLICTVFASQGHSAIELRSKLMRTNDGLPSNSIRCMYQDSKGFLWFGTLNGLSRYDGNTFLTFQPRKDETGKFSLADNRIHRLTEDKHEFLWIATTPELFSCYDLQRARFVDFTGCGEYGQNYSNLLVTSCGDVWLWHVGNGARRVKTSPERTMTSVAFSTEHGNLPDNRVHFVREGREGRIWIGTANGLTSLSKDGTQRTEDRSIHFTQAFEREGVMYLISAQGDVYSCTSHAERPRLLASMAARDGKHAPTGIVPLKNKCIVLTPAGAFDFDYRTNRMTPNRQLNFAGGEVLTDNRGDHWVYNHTGRVAYIPHDTEIIREFRLIPEDKMSYIDHERYHVVHDSRGIIWISTYGNGLFAYHKFDGRMEHFVSEMNDASPITSDFLLYVTEDRSGCVWVSCEFSGLSRLSVSNEGIVRLYPESRELFDRSNTIRMLTQTANGDIWVGTRKGGLYRYDASLKTQSAIQHFPSNVYAVEEDLQGRIWLGTRGDGLKIGDKWYRHSAADEGSLAHNHIFAIHRDRKGRMWIGTFGGGLDLAERQADGTYRFRHFFRQKYGLTLVRVMEEDDKGMIWMGSSEGIAIFHPDSLLADSNNYRLFSHTNGRFCSNEIRCLYRDDRGGMWVGTSGAGLSRCTPQNNYRTLEYKRYGSAEGLANDVVQSILGDNRGSLWIATEYGLSKFNQTNASFTNHFFSSHTLGNVYSENSACTGPDGKLLFGTNYGLAVVDPRQIPDNDFFPPAVLTALYINGTYISPDTADSPLQQSLAYQREIRLKHFQNSFRIDFSTFNYSEMGQTQYMYRLEPYDKSWSTPSPLSFAAYKYLPPGAYTLHVKSCNGSGVWNEHETLLNIIIAPPIWKSGWAFLAYALLLLIILFFVFRTVRNINRLRNRIAVEQQLTEYKLVFFTNISHEFRTPLTLIQGAMEKIQRLGKLPREYAYPLQTMSKNTQRMLRLVNQLMLFRKMQNNKLALSLEETDVIAFLHEIFLSFGDVAEQKKMDFRFVTSHSAYRMFVDKSNLDKVTYNLLSNAFKYTPSEGSVQLSITVDEEKKTLRIEVSDTGVGIPKEKQNELFKRFMQSSFSGDSIGVGLHLSHELVNVHKGNISYREREGGGSVFTVILPADKDIYESKDFLIADNILIKEANEQTICSSEANDKPHEAFVPPVPPLNKRKILIIEDDNEIRTFLQEEISPYFNVETAPDGLSGFEKAQTCEADLIICDVFMPGMTGFELTKKLKADFATSHIPIILLTAFNSPEKHLKGIESGADAYIAKPFSIKLLLARVFGLIEQRDKMREKFSSEPGLTRAVLYTTDRDKEFAERLAIVLEQHLSRPEFSIDEFAQLMHLGRTVFYRKLRGITGYSPNEYLRSARMKKAAELLLSEENFTVAEVSYKVGINDPFYFSKCFKAQFGVSPSVYQHGTTPDTKEAQA